MTTVIAGRAIFGERRGEHGLLAWSGLDPREVRKLASFTDLPSLPPARLGWQPYYSGAGVDGRYFIARTAQDPNASRPGMVRTQLIIFSSIEAASISSLSPLFQELEKSWSIDSPLESLEFDLSVKAEHKPPSGFEGLLHSVADLLCSRSDRMPIAVLDQLAFPDLMISLWERLWGEIRKEFSFGFSFDPADLTGRRFDVVAVPEQLRRQWGTYPYIASSTQETENTSLGAPFILGGSAKDDVKRFLQAAELPLPNFSQLSTVILAAGYWKALGTNPSFAALGALARLLAVLSPDGAASQVLKAQVADLIGKDLSGRSETQSPERISADEVLSFRNFPFASLPNLASVLGMITPKWLSASLLSDNQGKSLSELKPVLQALTGNTSQEWKQQITIGLHQVMGMLSHEQARIVAIRAWDLMTKTPSLVPVLFASFPRSLEFEQALVNEIPGKLDPLLGEDIAKRTVAHDWYRLYGITLVRFLAPEAALDRYLQSAPEALATEPILQMIALLQPLDAIKYTIKNQNFRVLSCTADLIIHDVSLLSHFDAGSPAWRTLLLCILRKKPVALQTTAQARQALFALLDLEIDCRINIDELLIAFSENGITDLSEYPQRGDVWAILPRSVVSEYAYATASSWLDCCYSQEDCPAVPESAIRQVIFQPRLSLNTFRGKHRRLCEVGLWLLVSLSESTEASCGSWLNAVIASRQSLTRDQSVVFGRLIVNRHWNGIGQRLKSLIEYDRRTDLHGALAIFEESQPKKEGIATSLFEWTSSFFGVSSKPKTRDRAMNTRDAERSKIFISYSHQDKLWLDRLHVHLKPLERDGRIDRWDDTRLRTSQLWRDEIRRAIDAARVAVLLISADFLASDFIATDELPPLLAAAEHEGLAIMPVIVKPSRFTKTSSLSRFQAANSPDKPLSSMDETERESFFVLLTEEIIQTIEKA